MRDHISELDTDHYFDHVLGASANQLTYTYKDDLTIADNTTLKVDGRAIIQGRDVMAELDEMRDALLLLKRDVDMEAKYPELAEAKRQYEEILDKYKTWDALNYGNEN